MIQKFNELLFFKRLNYQAYLTSISQEGYEVVSITDFLEREKAVLVDPSTQILDISSIANSLPNPDSLQLLFEQLISSFSEDQVFIADFRYKEIIEFELRHCFKEFKEIDISDIDFENSNDPNNAEKAIKLITDLVEGGVQSFIEEFKNKLYGHENFKIAFAETLENFLIFNRLGEHKVLSLFLMGESGVGKTEVARIIHRCLGGKKKLAKINFGNYSSKDALNSLIGSPRGYIGSDGGELFTRVKESDIGLILIDEFEKSNAAVFNYFLDVLESGKLTNSLGEEIDVSGFLIVFTSNIDQSDFGNRIAPELRSRFDLISKFELLSNQDKKKFVQFRFRGIINKYEEYSGHKLRSEVYIALCNKINVINYVNMRDLNKQIKKEFVRYLKST